MQTKFPVRKLILWALALFLFFTALDVIHWYASPSANRSRQEGTVITLPGSSIVDAYDIETVRSVVFHLAAPLSRDGTAVLRWYDINERAGQQEKACAAGATEISFELPAGKYYSLDCFIFPDPGISEVTVSDGDLSSMPYSFNPLNTLLPPAVLLLIALLFLLIRPLNRLARWIDRHVLDAGTRWQGITVLYVIFTAVVLMHHVYVTAYHRSVMTGASAFAVPLIVFILVSVVLGKLWKDWLFWVLLPLWLLKLFGVAWRYNANFSQEISVYIMAAYAFFGCYGAGRVIRKEDWKKALSLFCALWVLAAVVYAVFGIVVAATGNPIANLGSESFRIRSGRLHAVYHPVTTGIILSTAMAVAILGCALTGQKILKAFYVLTAAVLFLAGSLTGTRTAYILSGVAFALLLSLVAYNRLKPGEPKNFFLTTGKWIALTLLFAAIAAAIAFVQSYTSSAFNLLRTRGGLMLSVAYAEGSAGDAVVRHRGFVISADPDVTFSSRITIWKNALEVITAKPENYLLGQSLRDPIEVVDEIRASRGLFYVYHCHNTFLQTTLENGIPALLLYLTFIGTFVFHGVRVLKNRNLPFWQRLIPLPAVVCLVSDLADSTCHVTFGYPQMTLLYLFIGFTIALSRQSKKKSA